MGKTTIKLLIGGSKGGDYTVERGAPAVGQFLQAREGRETPVLYSDIATQKNGGIGGIDIIDVTTTHPCADYVFEAITKIEKPYQPGMAGDIGENRKKTHYEMNFHVDQKLVAEPVKLSTVSFETSGAVGKETGQWIKKLASDIARGKNGLGPHETPSSEDMALALRQTYQRYSVSLQAWKARTVAYTIKYLTLDNRPTYPYVPGGSNCNLIRPDPPAYSGLPINLGRRYVVTPPPPRGTTAAYRLRRR